jgi:uncharacterized glyoxalase superfamily protein PhnB
MAYKPETYTSVAPYLVVDDARRTLAFLVAVFEAERLRVIEAPDGRIRHAEVRIDDTVVMMGEAPGGPQTNVHVYVPDVDATFRRALAAGGTIVQEVADMDDGDRRGGVRDPSGTIWWVATQRP